MSGNIQPARIGAVFAEMFSEPPYGAAHLRNDAVEPCRRCQRIFDDRKIDPERQQALGEERVTLLVAHLPIAAVDKRKRRRSRIGGEKQIEPLARGLAVSEVETSGVFVPHPGTACRPISDNRVALRDRRGVVVCGIELGTVHSAVQHVQAPVAIRWTWAVTAVCHAFDGGR
jgi:hypothetical protein